MDTKPDYGIRQGNMIISVWKKAHDVFIIKNNQDSKLVNDSTVTSCKLELKELRSLEILCKAIAKSVHNHLDSNIKS